MFKKSIAIMALFLLCFSLTACTHSLKIKNLRDYRTGHSFTHVNRPVRIGLSPYTGELDQQWFYNVVIDELDARQEVGNLQSNYHPESEASIATGFRPDIILSIEPEVVYSGSGWNYPITFPGFILFTHAWNGYVYRADVKTKITIRDNTGEVLEVMDLDTTYDIRHCDFGRGFWSASGWWMPGWGATAAIAGFFMVKYDDDATNEFQSRVRNNYSWYIVENIIQNEHFKKQLNNQLFANNVSYDFTKKDFVLKTFDSHNVSAGTAEALSSVAIDALSPYYNIQSLDAVAALNNVVEEKLKAGCDDTKCILDVAGAMDISQVVTGKISKLGDRYLVSLMLIQTKGDKLGVVKRSAEECQCSEGELMDVTRQAALELIGVTN